MLTIFPLVFHLPLPNRVNVTQSEATGPCGSLIKRKSSLSSDFMFKQAHLIDLHSNKSMEQTKSRINEKVWQREKNGFQSNTSLLQRNVQKLVIITPNVRNPKEHFTGFKTVCLVLTLSLSFYK